MPVSQLPPWFLPLFFTTFVVNAAYVGTIFLLRQRLATPAIQAKGYNAPRLVGGSPGDLMRMLNFVFSARHIEFGDPTITRLTWAVRVLFPVGLVLTLLIFALFLRAV